MKPAAFAYHAPESVADAISLLGESADAKLIAGGQSLMPMLNMRLAQPSALIDIGGIGGLSYVHRSNGHLAVGALTTYRTLERAEVVASDLPVILEAVQYVGHRTIRNRGTVGGSMAHADPSGELPLLAVALDAVFVIEGPTGSRTVPAEKFFIGNLTTTLEPDEMLTEIRFGVPEPGTTFAFQELSRRYGDYALASVLSMVRLDEHGHVASCRVTVGGANPIPLRIAGVEQALVGAEPSAKAVATAAASLTSSLEPQHDPHADAEYRRHVAGTLARRTLSAAIDRAQEQHSNMVEVTVTINGQNYVELCETRRTLADFIRHDCGLTGTHLGCEHGVCGACTVRLDGKTVRSCLMLAVQARGADITTIEGLAEDEELHPIQQAFHDNHGLQCGFCTPGMLLMAQELLEDIPDPTEEQVREQMSGNLCRCTGYEFIVDSVMAAAEQLR